MRASGNNRPVVDGKFFRIGTRKFYPKGLTYGPFAANCQGEPFPSAEQAAADFRQIRELGVNLLRVYHLPPRWFMDLAAGHELRLLIDIPWSKHQCFLQTREAQDAARLLVRKAVRASRRHPAVFAYSLANEIPADIVRWNGAEATGAFIDSLVEVAKAVDPECLCTFASFPPTEYLRARAVDFVTFNVFLHEREPYGRYLGRLQMMAGGKPLVLGECGIDSLREGEKRKREILSWTVEEAFRAGLAGVILFSYTDDWHRGGAAVEDWAFGLTTRERKPKESFWAVQRQFSLAPYYPPDQCPKVSVVVACHNGGRTLRVCLESLTRLNYPDYEVILVDDGSTDETPQIALSFPQVEYVRQDHYGLSVARNTGMAVAAGAVIAFTDADCRADEDWLHYLVGDLLANGDAAVGGHNLLPPEDSRVAAAVMASPGGPTHVMLTDREAEHIPGCNMAFLRSALAQIGGFDPIFRRAGDDVDVCWRLQELGLRIGFSPGGFVWHYRRSTVTAYFRQQYGYGEAEALLARKHPDYFNAWGSSVWRGRIYSVARTGVRLQRAVIYHGLFGTGLFQRMYDPSPESLAAVCTSFEYHALITVPSLLLATVSPFFVAWAAVSVLLPIGLSVAAAVQAELPQGQRAFWSRPLIALLCLLQPMVRGWARYQWRLKARSVRPTTFRRAVAPPLSGVSRGTFAVNYWSEHGDRFGFLQSVLAKLAEEAWQWKPDVGWGDFDAEVFGRRWSRLRLVTVAEDLGPEGKMVRCRLRTFWSLRARWALGLVVVLEALLLVAFVSQHPWMLLALVALPLLVVLVQKERRSLLQLLAAMVDEAAGEAGFRKMSDDKAVPARSPAASPVGKGESPALEANSSAPKDEEVAEDDRPGSPG